MYMYMSKIEIIIENLEIEIDNKQVTVCLSLTHIGP